MVKFPLSFAAFTEVLIDIYMDQKFTEVSRLFYRGKNPKHGIISNKIILKVVRVTCQL